MRIAHNSLSRWHPQRAVAGRIAADDAGRRPGWRKPFCVSASSVLSIQIASGGHQCVWPLVERTMTTQKDYPVVLYDEA